MKQYLVFSIAWLSPAASVPQEIIANPEKMLVGNIPLNMESGIKIHHNAIYPEWTGFVAGKKMTSDGFGNEERMIRKHPDGSVAVDDKPVSPTGEIYGDFR